MSKLTTEDLQEMQRLIIEGLPRYRAARYCLMNISNSAGRQANSELRGLIKHIATSDKVDKEKDKESEYRICIAFTWKGLRKLGLSEKSLRNVPLAFKEGMACDIRASRLKDQTGKWKWSDAGGVKCKRDDTTDKPCEIHAIIMLFSKVDYKQYDTEASDKLDADWKALEQSAELNAMTCVHKLPDAFAPEKNIGHFGFRDGISQPYIEGSGTSRRPSGKFAGVHVIKPGEFILGHRNEFAHRLPPLWVSIEEFPAAGVLQQYGLERNRRDFGRNGTYLVFRQMRQYVDRFKSFLTDAASTTVPGEITDEELIAAKIVGRWRSGAPLTMSPTSDNKDLSESNDFMYEHEDRYGFRCPIGSHVRRSYPRDSIVEQGAPIDSEAALSSSRRRRLIRRGRPYYSRNGTNDVGLHFICLNAVIREQFEFVQETWINNRRFGVTRDEVDPLAGSIDDTEEHKFTIQKSPVSQSLSLDKFVSVVGGGYFFLPSIPALKFLASLDKQ